MTVKAFADEFTIGAENCLVQRNQIRVEPNSRRHICLLRIGLIRWLCQRGSCVAKAKWLEQAQASELDPNQALKSRANKKNLAHSQKRADEFRSCRSRGITVGWKGWKIEDCRKYVGEGQSMNFDNRQSVFRLL